jgi:hypothetical protein
MLTKKLTCANCHTMSEATLVRNITGSGTSQVYWKCNACHKNAVGTARFIQHALITGYGIKIDDIPTEKDYRVEKCAVCGELGAEYHHWAPRHLFGDNADKWPTAYLCKAHHDEWHNILTPNMAKQKGK